MKIRVVLSALLPGLFLALTLFLIPDAHAQQTLGGITGTVSDTSGAVISGATVTLVGNETKLSRTQTTSNTGSYSFVNLPIGTYTLTINQQGFRVAEHPFYRRPSQPHGDRERGIKNRQCKRVDHRRRNAAAEHGRHDQRLRDG